MAKQNPAYVKWIEMEKGGEQKMVHPGNVQSHLNVGWTFKDPADAEAYQAAPGTGNLTFQSLTLPELTETVVEHEKQKAKEKPKRTRKPGSKKAKKSAGSDEKLPAEGG